MSDMIIRAEGLGKRYRIRHERARQYTTLRDTIAGTFSRLLRPQSTGPDPQPSAEDFWALKDVSFEIKQGEVLGIIGRNGAGKSTLLKILSRITEPTEGRITLRGRVASLLEVGTGFHPELTGRENIYLNGAILGMSKTEIRAKFDEIVAFAEVEKFLDTPVKHFSSGMYVRLAFAVAAHLEPEILIIDEVLAVGDAEFQKKSLGKMGEIARGGRTVLFVSHQMSAVLSFCNRVVVLNQGRVQIDDTAQSGVRAYLQNSSLQPSFERAMDPKSKVRIVAGQLLAGDLETEESIHIKLKIWADSTRTASLDLRLTENTGMPVGFGSLGTLDSAEALDLLAGVNEVHFAFPTSLLANGSYAVSIDLTVPFREFFDRLESCLSFSLERGPKESSMRIMSQQWNYGSVEIPLQRITSQVSSMTAGKERVQEIHQAL